MASKGTHIRRTDHLSQLHGQLLSWDRFLISPDMSKVLFFTDKHQQWRHSARSNVWLHHVQARTTEPLGGGPHYPPRIQTASWAPRGANGKTDAPLAYVMDNDLYVQVPDGKPLRVTSDGTAQVFNAVPDWVYEEEVVATDTTYWCESRADGPASRPAHMSLQGRPLAPSSRTCALTRRRCPSTRSRSTIHPAASQARRRRTSRRST